MTILDLIKSFMIEQGFNVNAIRVENRDTHSQERVVLYYQEWGFAILDRDEKLFFLPFKTNHPVYINPANPDFFKVLKLALRFPRPGERWYQDWYK